MKWYKVFFPFYKKSALKMVEECQEFIERNSKILDVGCGSAIFSQMLKERNKNIDLWATDISDRRIFDIPFKVTNGKILPFSERSFDLVFLNYVLHHSQDPITLLSEAKRVSSKIIIYEDIPSDFFSKIYCFFHGFFFSLFWGKKNKINFKKFSQWQEIFKKLHLEVIYQKIFREIKIWPVQKAIFVLKC